MSEQPRVFEVDVIVRAHGQEDARISREYVSTDKMSTDGVAGEIWKGFSDQTKAKMHPVSDGR
jgi:hypothetical protein